MVARSGCAHIEHIARTNTAHRRIVASRRALCIFSMQDTLRSRRRSDWSPEVHDANTLHRKHTVVFLELRYPCPVVPMSTPMPMPPRERRRTSNDSNHNAVSIPPPPTMFQEAEVVSRVRRVVDAVLSRRTRTIRIHTRTFQTVFVGRFEKKIHRNCPSTAPQNVKNTILRSPARSFRRGGGRAHASVILRRDPARCAV